MDLESVIQILIYAHAGFGGLALLTGTFALIAKKGSATHKRTGKVFFIAMLISAFLSTVVAVMPNHHSSFLFSIAIFSSYFLISGYRSLNFKNNVVSLKLDKIIAYVIVFIGAIMVLYPLLFLDRLNVVSIVFGVVSMVFGFRDLLLFKDKEKLRKVWLRLHLGKMLGAYISSVTAFVVVNNFFPSIYGWFLPGIIGAVYITFWMRKVKKSGQTTKVI